jgi:diguanylate cyclase (GGDEF)-like protein
VLLDVQTLFVAMFAAFLMFAVTLAGSRRALPDCPELALWSWGTWAMVLAFILLSVRLVGPEWISIVGGNTMMFVGVHLNSRALHRFVTGRPAPAWQLALVVIGAAAISAMLNRPLSERTALVSAVIALQGVPMFMLVLTKARGAEPALRTVAVSVAIGIVSLAARATHALWAPGDYDSFWRASLGNGLTYLAAYLFPLGAGIGFILANLERTGRQLHQQATYDALTGCVQRGVFTPMLEKLAEHARRASEPLSLLLMDLDHFKSINDTHGHQAGDQVLVTFAKAVRARLRAADLLGRMGGEEFAVLLAGTDAPGAMRLADELRRAVEGLTIEAGNGTSMRITVSAGVAGGPVAHGESGAELYRRADAALYESKRSGRNRVTLAAEA